LWTYYLPWLLYLLLFGQAYVFTKLELYKVGLIVPSVSKKQHNFMAAVANNPKFAKKVGVSKSVGEEFMKADTKKPMKMAAGGMPMVEKDGKKVPAFAADGVGKMKKGGMAHSDMAKDKPMMKKVAEKAVKGHEKKLHGMKHGGMAVKKMAKGGGCEVRGKTKGTMIKMKKGGAC
jgi:hypothetical protein